MSTSESTIESSRPLANFPPSIWGDRFLSFSLDASQLEAYGKGMEMPKEQVRMFILNPDIDANDKISLIYSVIRLGLTYVFSKEIDAQLNTLFNRLNYEDYQDADLYTTSLHFQVFRNFGYRFSCDVFNKFKDYNSGEFKEDIATNVRGMIGLYQSAHFRIKGESILDEAIAFTQSKLKAIEKTLDGTLARQVKHVLDRPFHRGHIMVEARLYLIHYEEEISRYDWLMKLAKMHFNYLQLLQKEELIVVTKWWKDLELEVKTPYVRDRVPELYVWILALFLEPYYSEARIISAKVILLVLALDDTYDAYATIEEMRLLTRAIERWDTSAISQLPEYIKPFYEILLNEFAGFNKQGRTNLTEASKKAFQNLARAYLEEAEWRHRKHVPSFEEYMRTGLTTSTHDVLSKTALIGMSDIVTEEAFLWYQTHPKILIASETIARLQDDVMTVEFQNLARAYLEEAEWRHRKHVPSFEEYMRTGLTTSTHDVLSKTALIGMSDIVTEEAFLWYQTHPKILIASETIARLQDDVMTVEFERERAPSATGVDAYMNSFSVPENVAIDALKKLVDDAWKDISEACLQPRELPMDVLAPIVNLTRMIDVAYRYNDGFTFPEKTFKEYVTLLFLISIPM